VKLARRLIYYPADGFTGFSRIGATTSQTTSRQMADSILAMFASGVMPEAGCCCSNSSTNQQKS